MTLRSLLTRAWHRAMLEIDLLHWRWQTRRLRQADAPPAGKVALVCDLMAAIVTAKSEAIFATGLRRRGHAIVVLLPRPDHVIERIFLATGPTRFVYAQGRFDATQLQAHAERAEGLLGEIDGRDGLADLRIDGFRIGRNALSKAVRELRVGRVDVSDPAQRRVVVSAIGASLAAMEMAREVVTEVRPDLAIFSERGYTPAGEVFDACLLQGVDVVQWVGAPKSDSLLFKRYELATRDQHPFALGADTWAALRARGLDEVRSNDIMAKLAANYESGAWFNRQQLHEGKSIYARDETRRRLGVAPARKVAVVFAHILYDATFFYGDSLFPDYEAWLVETVRCAIANPQLDWIVKVHPVNVWRSRMDGKPMEQLESIALRNAFGELPPHVRILAADTQVNTFSLFAAIDYGLTVRGTIGMELPCFGIPVVTAGTGRYSGHGFTLDPATQTEYRQVLAHLHEVPPLQAHEIASARLYTWGAFFQRPFLLESFRIDFHANTLGIPHLAMNVGLAEPLKMVSEEPTDLADIAAWMSVRERSDLLATGP